MNRTDAVIVIFAFCRWATPGSILDFVTPMVTAHSSCI